MTKARQRTYYHATSLEAAERIAEQGFREQFLCPDGDLGGSGGNLGVGIYVSSAWRTALWFGRVLLRVSLAPGTSILDARAPPDPRVLRYLQREFGKDVLRRPPWKVLPANKKLTLQELREVFRHHYQQAWVKPYRRPRETGQEWSRRRERHLELLAPYRSLLLRYGFHGYGELEGENGVVVFAGDRVRLEEVVAELPAAMHGRLCDDLDMAALRDLEEVRALFQAHGSARARELAARIRGASA